MNYRHIYHAGNFADIFKHIVLTRIIRYMQGKAAAFRVLDTHAGIGLYDLSSAAANKTAEYASGLNAFLHNLGLPNGAAEAGTDYAAFFTAAAGREPLLAPYLQALSAAQSSAGGVISALRFYPGSPWLARHLLRRQDRLTAIELHKQDYQLLKQQFAGDYQTKILNLDGRLALKAQLPPKEKRGLILVDPPFEEPDEFAALAAGTAEALRRFPQGVYMLWYPVKNYHQIDKFAAAAALSAAQCGAGAVLRAELRIRRPSPATAPRLDGSGLIIINPPYILTEELQKLAPLLLRSFAQDNSAKLHLQHLRRA